MFNSFGGGVPLPKWYSLPTSGIAIIVMGLLAVFALSIYFCAPVYVQIITTSAIAFLGLISIRQRESEGLIVKHINEVLHKCSAGDLEYRVKGIPSSEVGIFKISPEYASHINYVNDLIDKSDAFIREASAASHAASQGRYFRKFLISGLSGSFRAAAENINQASDYTDYKIREVSEAAIGFETLLGDAISDAVTSIEDIASSSHGLTDKSELVLEQSMVAQTGAEESERLGLTAAHAVEELTASIGDINQRLEEAADLSGQAVGHTKTADDVVASLSTASVDIGSVIDVISDIASQTNLLALNASIEAARAGDAGRGFSVVANEVKQLAEQTSVATQKTVQQIQAIQAGGSSAEKAVTDISNITDRINAINSEIAETAEQQEIAAREISSSLAGASDVTAQVAEAVNSVANSAQEAQASSIEMLDRVSTVEKSLTIVKSNSDEFLSIMGGIIEGVSNE